MKGHMRHERCPGEAGLAATAGILLHIDLGWGHGKEREKWDGTDTVLCLY